MKTVRVRIDPQLLASLPKGRVDKSRRDATNENSQYNSMPTMPRPCRTRQSSRAEYESALD